ncbi:SGNH/GDSL hydrolase family protein [Mycoplasmopsis hyopharyngis]|uniref:SGNH/GDSL hydrolase family protein n=1 Tax=Mycoplasmopsis hyopharyngis TaxID=29558 RepID=UPI0038731002
MQQNTNENKKSKKKKIIILSSVFSALALAGLGVGISFIPFKKTKNSDFDKGGAVIPKPPVVVEPPVIPDPILPIDPIEDPDANLVQKRDQSSNLIRKDQKVKYFAFGDSISAGFSGELPKDYPGEFKDGKVTGASFPAYLASFISKLSEGKLESFDNYSASGSTIVDWMELLGIQYDKNDADEVNYYATSVTDKLDYFVKNKFNGDKAKAKEEILKKIKESNLITITLGANDVIQLLIKLIMDTDISKIISEFMDKNTLSQETLLKEITPKVLEVMRVVRTLLQKRLATISKELKIINPKANIVFASYPLPMQRILLMINDILPASIKDIVSVDKILANLLTEKIKESAILHKNNFINLYDADYWKEHQEKLTPMILDIHPSIFGYKKMAIELFIKMSAGVDLSYKVAKKYGITKNHFDNLSFSTKDQNDWILEMPTKTSDETFEKIFGTNNDEFMFKSKDDIYESVKDQLDQNHFGKRMNDDATFGIVASLNITIKNLFKNPKYLEIDPDKHLANFFEKENGKNLDLFQAWFQKSNFLANAMNKIQKDITSKDWDADGIVGTKKIKPEYLKQIITEIFDYNQIFTLVKELIGSDFATSNHAEFADVLSKFLTSLPKNPMVVQLLKAGIQKGLPQNVEKYISKTDLETLVLKVLNSSNLSDVIKHFVDSIFALKKNQGEKFANASTFEELVKVIFDKSNNFSDLTKSMEKLIIELTQDNAIKPVLARVLKTFVKTTYPDLVKGITDEQTTKLISGLINSSSLFVEKFEILPIVFQEVFAEVATHGFKFDIGNFTKNVSTKISTHLKSLEYGKVVLGFGKIIAQNQELKESIDSIKTLTQNLSTFLKDKFGLEALLTKMLKENASAYLDENEISLAVKVFLNKENITLFTDYLLELTVKNSAIYEQSNTPQELFDKLFDKDSSANINSFVSTFINKVFNYPETQQLIQSLAKKHKFNEGIEEAKFNPTIKALLDFVLKQDKELDISSSTVKALFASLLKSNFSEFNINEIITSLKTKFANFADPAQIIKILKSMLMDDGLRNHKEELEKLINNIVKFILSKEDIKKSLANNVSEFSHQYVKDFLTKEQLSKLVYFVINNEDVFALASKTLKYMFKQDKAEIEKIQDFNDLVKLAFAKDQEIANKLKPFAKKIINSLLSNKEISTVAVNALYKVLQDKSTIVKDVDKEKFAKVFGALLTKIPVVDQQIGLSEILIEQTTLQLKTNGLKFNMSEFSTKVFEALKTKFADQNKLKKTLLEIVKIFAQEQEFKNEVETIGKIFENTYDFAATKTDLISSTIKDFLKPFGIEEQELKTTIPALLQDKEIRDSLVSFVKLSIISLTSQEAQAINSFNEIIKKVFSKQENNDKLIAITKKLFTAIVKNEPIVNAISKVAQKTLRDKLPEILKDTQDANVEKLIASLFKFVSYFDSKLELVGSFAKVMCSQLGKNGKNLDPKVIFAAYYKELENKFKDKEFVATFVVEIPKMIKQNQEFVNQKETLKTILTNTIKYAVDKFKLQETIVSKVSPLVSEYVEQKDVETIVKGLLKEENYKDISEFFVTGIIDNLDHYQDATTPSDLIDKLFEKNNIYSLLDKIVKTLVDDEEVKKSFVNVFKKLKLDSNLDDEKIKKVASNLLLGLIELEKDGEFNFLKNFLKTFLKSLTDKTVQFNPKTEIDKFVNESKTKFTNMEEIVKLVKALVSKPQIKEISEDFPTLLKNIFLFVRDKFKLDEVVFGKIPASLKDEIKKEEFSKLFKRLTEESALYDLVNPMIKDLIINSDHYVSSKTILDLLKTFINHNKATFNLKDKLKTLITNISKYDETGEVVSQLIISYAKKFGFEFDDDKNKKLFKDLTKDLQIVLDNFGFVEKFATYIESNNDVTFAQLLEGIKNTLFSALDYKNPQTFIKLFELQSIKDNKQTIIEDIEKIVTAFSSKPESVDKIAELAKFEEKFGKIAGAVEELKKLLKSVLGSNDFKEIFKNLIDEFVDNSSNYKDANLWSKVIHKFLNSTKFDTTKVALKNMITSALKDSKFVGLFLAETLGNSFIAKGINFDAVSHNQKYFANFIDTFIKGVLKTDLLDIILDNVFDNIKSLQPEEKNIADYFADVKTVAIKGAIKFITSKDDQTISIKKAIEELSKESKGTNTRRSEIVFSNVDSESFARVINFLFWHLKASDGSSQLYSTIFNSKFGEELKKYKERVAEIDQQTFLPDKDDRSIFPAPMGSRTTETLNIKVDMSEMLSLIGKIDELQNIITDVFTPLAKQFWDEVASNNYQSSESAKKSFAYKAAQRIYTTLMIMVINNSYANISWQILVGPAVALASSKIEDAINAAFVKTLTGEKLALLKSKYNGEALRYVNLTNSYTVRPYYLAGMKKSRTGDKYASYTNSKHDVHNTDWIIYYSYYYKEKDPILKGEANIIQILKALKFGKLE